MEQAASQARPITSNSCCSTAQLAGGRDNQMAANAIPPAGNIVTIKQTTPDASTQSFDFVASWDAGTNPDFGLTDGQSNDSGSLTPGNYSVTENAVAGWTLSSVSCVSSLGDTEVNTALDLDNGETITCTFNNTQGATVTVVKQATPEGATSFDFDATGTGITPTSISSMTAPARATTTCRSR